MVCNSPYVNWRGKKGIFNELTPLNLSHKNPVCNNFYFTFKELLFICNVYLQLNISVNVYNELNKVKSNILACIPGQI